MTTPFKADVTREAHHPRPLISFVIPLKTKNTSNQREHWAVKAKRIKRERNATALWWPKGKAIPFPVVVTMVRLSPRTLDDDGVVSALKAVRDEIARQLGVDDGPGSPVAWEYGQARGMAAVQVTVEPQVAT